MREGARTAGAAPYEHRGLLARRTALAGSVLVLDDEEAIRRLFLEWFRPEGTAIRVAATAEEALAMVKESSPDLLIVDVSLPRRDGLAVLEEAITIDYRISGVVMTGLATVDLAVRAMKAGAADFLMKPLEREAVLATARRLLERRRLRTEEPVVKQTTIRSGAIRLASLSLQAFDQDDIPPVEEGPTEYERGFEEGERRAFERCRREHAVLADAVRKFSEAQAALRASFEDEVVALAFHIATKVLRESAETCREHILAQAKAALAAVPESGTVVIQVHPDDAPTLAAAQAELMAQRDLALTIKIEPVASLARGSCLVRTTKFVIDASLDAQLMRLGNALKNRVIS
ncbi:MAG: response regulator [Nitrospira sp.]|nr:response regulator [Nitrospira sp.]